MNHRNRNRVLAGVLLAAAVCCAVWAGNYIYQRGQEKSALEELQAEAKVETEEAEAAPEAGQETASAETEPVGLDPYVDFGELQARNPEIYAWITVPGTRVDYPILQREGSHQDYYLMHDVDGNLTASGSIYTESLNRKDFMDPNTVIYGHNMKNGTMFRDLHLYQEKEFFDSHPDVYIYLPGKRLTYEIFSAYEYDNRHLLKAFDFSDPEVYAAYLETALHPRAVNVMTRDGISLTAADRIITLSTCIGRDTSRYLVQAVLRREEPVRDGTALPEAESVAVSEDLTPESPSD